MQADKGFLVIHKPSPDRPETDWPPRRQGAKTQREASGYFSSLLFGALRRKSFAIFKITYLREIR